MKNQVILALALMLSAGTLLAQNTITVKNGTLANSGNYSNMDTFYNVQAGDVIVLNDETKGSPYVYEKFQIGSLVNKEGKVIVSNVALNYNAYNDLMVGKPNVNSSDDDAKNLTKSTEFDVMIGKDRYISVIVNSYDLRYFQLLSEGDKVSLIKRYDKEYKAKELATTSLTRDIPAMFKDKESYYLYYPDGSYEPLPSSKSKIMKSFQHGSEIKSFVKRNKLNVTKEQDLIQVIKYYNTLL